MSAVFRDTERNNWGLLLGWSFYLEGHPIFAGAIVFLLSLILLKREDSAERQRCGSRAFWFLCAFALLAGLTNSSLSFGWLALLALDHAALAGVLQREGDTPDAALWLALTFLFFLAAFLIPESSLLPEKLYAVETITFLFLPGAFLYTIAALRRHSPAYRGSLRRK